MGHKPNALTLPLAETKKGQFFSQGSPPATPPRTPEPRARPGSVHSPLSICCRPGSMTTLQGPLLVLYGGTPASWGVGMEGRVTDTPALRSRGHQDLPSTGSTERAQRRPGPEEAAASSPKLGWAWGSHSRQRVRQGQKAREREDRRQKMGWGRR